MNDGPSTRSPIAFSARELSVACALILIVFAIGVGLKATGSKWAGGETWRLGGDFVELYASGRVLNDRQGDRLYDLALEEQISHEVVPDTGQLRRAFAYPPFVAMLFQPLARLPFDRGLVAFLIATPLIFLGSLLMLSAAYWPAPEPRDVRTLMVLGGLSFFPFIGYTWLGAQISIIGFASIAVALCEEERGRLFWSGVALSLCLYKPTWLVLILPMLVVTGSGRQLAGFVCGGAALAFISLIGAGEGALLAFADRVRATIARSVTVEGLFNAYRYVDLNAFFRLLPYGRSTAGYVALAALFFAAAAALVSAWLRARTSDRPTRLLVWAATLTWTLVLNIYVPFYDTILVVAAAVIATAAIRARGWRGWHRLSPALFAVYVTPWLAEVLARSLRVQIDTLVLGGLGVLLLVEARRQQPRADAVQSAR